MPFNPDEFLAEKQAEVPVAGSAKQFDPDAFLASSETPREQVSDVKAPKVSTGESIGRAASQGATMGFGDELSAAAGALFPTATDKALNRRYSDRYASIRDTLRQENLTAQEANPVTSAISEIVASVPLAITSGGGLASLGAKSAVQQAAIQGGAYGLGKSKKESAAQAVEDAGISALLSAGIAKVASKLLPSKSSGDLAKIVKKGDEFEVSIPKTGDSFRLGKEMAEAMSDPAVQRQVSQELNAQKGNIDKVIGATKDSLGARRDELLAQFGDAPSDASKAIEFGHNSWKSIKESVNDKVTKGKDLLQKYVTGVEDALWAAGNGDLSKAPLKEVLRQQQDLGKTIFEDGVFDGAPAVKRAAVQFWSKLKHAVNTADEIAGSKGDIKNISDVYDSLYRMKDAKLNGATLKTLAVNPRSEAAQAAYDKFIQPFAKLPAGIRANLAPELEGYLTQDLQKSLLKAQIRNTITGQGPSTTDDGIVGWALKKAYLSPKNLSNIANQAGVFAAKVPSVPQGALSTIGSTGQTIAPAASALTVVE